METIAVIWETVKKLWPFEHQWMALHPNHTQLRESAKSSVQFGVKVDYKVLINGENVSEWCEENCKRKVKYHFLRDRDKVYQIAKLFGNDASARVGIVLIRFSSKKEAALFRLSFDHVVSL